MPATSGWSPKRGPALISRTRLEPSQGSWGTLKPAPVLPQRFAERCLPGGASAGAGWVGGPGRRPERSRVTRAA